MASEAEVVLADDATVTVDVSDNPDLAAVKGVGEAEDAVEPVVEVVEAKKPAKEPVAAAGPSEVTKALEEAKKAAEATAMAERQRADAASRLAAQREQEVNAALDHAAQNELALITQGIESATSQIEALEADLARAYESGDFKVTAQIQTRLAKAAAALDRMNETKTALETNPRKQPFTEGRVESPDAGNQPPPFENYVRQYTPRSQAWLRAHPECVPPEVGGNAQANAKLMSGHYAALAQGLAPDTDDYFRVIEEHTGHRKAEAEEAVPQPKIKTAPVPKVKPSAPPTREVPTTNGVPPSTRSVRLSPAQQEMAKLSFPEDAAKDVRLAFAKYARNLVELEAEGKMGRLTH